MTNDRGGAEEIFHRALDLGEEAREDFLIDACGGDRLLHEEVRSLLEAHRKVGRFLVPPPLEATLSILPDPLLGRTIGAYRVVRPLGSGGMSTVYLGERTETGFSMRVAIKLIRRGLDTEDILQRFRNERQVLANLDHPNVARLLDGGETEDGRPYLIMEYIEGTSIDRHCDERALSITRRLRLFQTVCSAVHYAHRNLVVHRDLKPGNIFVSGEGQVKLLDFGIAKVLARGESTTPETLTGQRPMTPRYASPEQIRGEPVTTASDVYSLGVVLYELITGHPPYSMAGCAPAEIERVICTEEPTRPSAVVGEVAAIDHGGTLTPESVSATREGEPKRLSRRLTGDLDNIVMLALRKEPERRYASVERLSDDVRRHLEGLPVLARPDTFGYRTSKFVRRNAAAVAISGLVVAALLAASIVSTRLYFRADRARETAQAALEEAETQRATAAEINRFLQNMFSSIDPQTARGRDMSLLREVLDRAATRVDEELGTVPAVGAALRRTIGNTYRSLGFYPEADEHLSMALDIRRGIPENESEVAESLVDLGAVRSDRGEYSTAESHFREALAIQRKTPDVGAPIAVTLDRLGRLLDTTGAHEEAERCLRESLAIRRSAGDGSAADVASSLVNLGTFLVLNKQAAVEAETLMREAVGLLDRQPEARPIDRANALMSLGSLLRDGGNHGEAEPMLVEALAIKRQILAPDHPEIGLSLTNLATLLERTGRFDEAEPMYRETLRIRTQSLGERHRDVGTTANNLAGVLRKTGRLRESEALYRSAVDIYRESLGADHAWVSIALANLLTVLEARDRCAAAESLFSECRRIQRTFVSDDHWRVAGVESIRGACLAARGRDAEAEPLLIESARILESDRGPDDDWTRAALQRLVQFYETRGRAEEAAPHRARMNRSGHH